MIRLPHRIPLGEILVEAGAVSQAQMDEGLATQQTTGEQLGRCLVRLGHVTEDELLNGLARQLGLDRVEPSRITVPEMAVRALPLDFVREHRVLPLALDEGVLTVVSASPLDPDRVEDVRLLSGFEVRESLATEREILEKISECYEITVAKLVEDLDDDDGPELTNENLHDIEVMASEPTVVNLVNVILSTAMKERASDVHVVPFENNLELRYRVDGVLRVMAPPPKHLHAALISRLKIMANMNIAERYLPQDGHIQITHGGHRVDIRVGTMPTLYGESVVMRLLEKGDKIKTLLELGLDEERVSVLGQLVEKPHGIFLSTGPTGSGKTTTLYSILHSIYSVEKKILTLEDPVEYELNGVAQIPVRPQRDFTFAKGLRAILRQDPDVIMVGEIRDSETAEIAIRAALTGHLVFSTLHTNDSSGAVARLIDMGIEPFLIASSVEGVIAQRLVRRICERCRTATPLSDETKQSLDVFGVPFTDEPYQHGEGCEDCRGTGYRGRIALFELLVMRHELRDLILNRASSAELKAAAAKEMVSLQQDGLRRAREGVTTMDEVLRVVLREQFDS